ncbi:MAG: F0F1 ATP synthase subunit epsilon [Dethiobacteria bacterium]|jgi:F-type H+-transporting ATPase subunit epsilon
MTTLKLDVVAPQGMILTEEVKGVIAPGTEGYLGIRPRHAPLLTSLKAGVLYYRKVGDKVGRMAVSGGFMEVGPAQVIVLADTAELASKIDVEKARQEKAQAEKQLRERPPGFDPVQAEEELQRCNAWLKAAAVE